MLNDPGPGIAFVHAAGVDVGGRLLLLVGASGSGKSTLTALLLARGHRMLGDDVLRFSTRDAVFNPVPRSLKLDAESMSYLDIRLSKSELLDWGIFFADSTTFVSPVALCRDWEARPGRPWGVVVLEGPPHAGAAGLEPQGEGEAAVRLMQSVLGAEHRAGADAAPATRLRLLESLGDAVAYRAHGGDPAALADLIESEAGA